MKIDINDLSEYDLLGYDRELRSFIMDFIDKYYPLTSEDMGFVLEGKDTTRTVERKYIRNLLLQIKEEIIKEELEKRKTDLNKSFENDTMNFQVKKSLEFKKLMIERLKEQYAVKTTKKL